MATVKHLHHSHSDHCPLLVELAGVRERQLGIRPFKFQAAWLLHCDFQGWLDQEWKWEGNLMGALGTLSEKLTAWNKNTVGCVLERKKRVRRRLQWAMRELGRRQSIGLLKL